MKLSVARAQLAGQLELPGMTSKDCRQALHAYHALDPYQWALFDEFQPYTGAGITRIDVLAVNCYRSSNCHTIAYEIKVSRQDFLNEVKRPNKRRLGLLWSNQFFFVAPMGLLKPAEIPIECGLKEVMPDLTLAHTVSAPGRDRLPPSWVFVAALARRVARVEVKQFNPPQPIVPDDGGADET